LDAYTIIISEPLMLQNRNCKLESSTAPTEVKSWKPAYSQVLIQSKIDRKWVRSRESGRQAGRQEDIVPVSGCSEHWSWP